MRHRGACTGPDAEALVDSASELGNEGRDQKRERGKGVGGSVRQKHRTRVGSFARSGERPQVKEAERWKNGTWKGNCKSLQGCSLEGYSEK